MFITSNNTLSESSADFSSRTWHGVNHLCCSFRRVKLKILPTKNKSNDIRETIHYASNSLHRGSTKKHKQTSKNKHGFCDKYYICVCVLHHLCPLTHCLPHTEDSALTTWTYIHFNKWAFLDVWYFFHPLIKPWWSPRRETSQHLAKPPAPRSQRRNIFEIRRGVTTSELRKGGADGKPPWFPKDPTHQNPKDLHIFYQPEKILLIDQKENIFVNTRWFLKTVMTPDMFLWIPKSFQTWCVSPRPTSHLTYLSDQTLRNDMRNSQS